MIYLDHAATTKVREEVLEAMLPFLREQYGNPSSVYTLGREAKRALEEARGQVAKALNAAYAREIYFTGCGTESDNWAISGAAYANAQKGKHIITSKVEHHAVLHTLANLEKRGFSVTYLDVDEYGAVSLEDVKKAVRDDTILITIMFANNEVGTINPIAEIGAFAREKGIIFHTDAVQAVGHVPIDVQAMHIDMLSLSGHKLYAPKGVGALYIRNGIKIEPYIHGGAQERKRRAGTENMASIVGLGKAIELAVEEMPEESERLKKLRDGMIEKLLTIPKTHLNGHPTNRLPGNVNVSLEYVESEASLFSLDLEGIACSSGSACTSGSLESSHVLLAMGIPPEIAKGSLRFTLGRENTQEELDETVEKLAEITERLRRISPLCPKGKDKCENECCTSCNQN